LKIPASLQPLLPARSTDVPSLLKQLQVGQVLQGKVVAQVQPGLLRLQIAATELLARSQVQIAEGTRLKLEVVQRSPMPELKIIQAPTIRDIQLRAMRSALSRQLPPADVRQALHSMRQQPLTERQADAMRQLVTVLQNSGLKPEQLTAPQLRQAVNQSGILHESRLLQTTLGSTAAPAGATAQTAPTDTKMQLLQVLTQLAPELALKQQRSGKQASAAEIAARARESVGDNLLSRLIRLIEGSISRVQLQQTAALPLDDSPRQAWQLDLPIHLPDESTEAMLRIQRESAGSDDATEQTWSVNIAFQFDSIGTLQCRVALAGDRVSTTFWCEREQTHLRVERRLPTLRQALEAQGLEVVHLAGVLGEPPEPLINVPRPDLLLDERA
jgi:hypothetical protein